MYSLGLIKSRICLFVVELRGDPGQAPFQIGKHKLEGLGPLLLRVELGFDGVGAAAASCVLYLSFLNVHPDIYIEKIILSFLVFTDVKCEKMSKLQTDLYGRQKPVSPFSTSSLNCWTQSRKATMAWSNLLSQKNLRPPEQYRGSSWRQTQQPVWWEQQSRQILT